MAKMFIKSETLDVGIEESRKNADESPEMPFKVTGHSDQIALPQKAPPALCIKVGHTLFSPKKQTDGRAA